MVKHLFLFLILIVSSATHAETVSSIEPNEVVCLAQAVYFEANGASEKMQHAVANVIINRTQDPKFPNTICGVVHQRTSYTCQFSWYCTKYKIKYVSRWTSSLITAFGVLRTRQLDNSNDFTDGSIYFHDTSVQPEWSQQLTEMLRINNLVFYK